MKNFIYKLAIICMGLFVVTSCDEEPIPTFDTQNGRAIAGFGGGSAAPSIIFNPAEDTPNVVTVGVSTLSTSDRSVVVELDMDGTTLDPALFSIDNLNPVIPAGQFTVDITITTLASDNLPSATDAIALNLVSVDGAEILDDSIGALAITLDVQCPSIDLDALPGDYVVTFSTFANFFGETDVDRQVVAGPGANQLTVVRGTFITEGAEDLIITIDPDTGSVIAVDETRISSQVSFGPNTYTFLPGGRVLTCVGIIEINLDFGGSVSGNAHSFNLLKQ